MNAQEKISKFQTEINFIRNPKIREFAEKAVADLPDYFFEVPASSTGKYHPTYALGDGGLLRHVQAAVRIAVELMNLKMFKYTEDEKDIIIVSLILHDGRKSGIPQQKFTVTEHPILEKQSLKENDELNSVLPQIQFDLICENIARHMGEFTSDFKSGKKVLEEPETKMQNFVFLCDYLSSRKLFEANFDIQVTRK